MGNEKNEVRKVMFVQIFRPNTVSIKLSRNDYDKYHQKYTYKQDILNDKFLQLVFDSKVNLVKPPRKTMFNNTTDQYDKLISTCKRGDDFNTTYNRIGSYVDAIYVYNANSERVEGDHKPFDVLDTDTYKSIDNNGICFKHIDYTVNKNAIGFTDIFKFQEANKHIASNIKANSCYFNLIIATYKEAIENVLTKGEKTYQDLTADRLCEILKIENKNQDLGLSIRSSVKFFEKFHLGLVVVNVYDDVIFKYIPDSRNKKISPNTLYVLVYNNHCYKLNSNVNSFVHKLNNKDVVYEEQDMYKNMENKL